jgi:hypothetical protein
VRPGPVRITGPPAGARTVGDGPVRAAGRNRRDADRERAPPESRPERLGAPPGIAGTLCALDDSRQDEC